MSFATKHLTVSKEDKQYFIKEFKFLFLNKYKKVIFRTEESLFQEKLNIPTAV